MTYRQPGRGYFGPNPNYEISTLLEPKIALEWGFFFVLSVSLVNWGLKKQISTSFPFFRLELWTGEQSTRFSTKIYRLLPESISREWLKWSTKVTPHIVGYLSLFQDIQMKFSQSDEFSRFLSQIIWGNFGPPTGKTLAHLLYKRKVSKNLFFWCPLSQLN